MNILETDRLIIRKLTVEDNEFILELLNSPNWLEYIGDRNIKTLKQAVQYIEGMLKNCHQHGYCLHVIELKESIIPVGLCGFLKREYLDSADIGFAILPDYERKGYTFEAAQAIVQYGISELQLGLIYGITSEKNSNSQNLLKKIGLKQIAKIHPKTEPKELLLFKLETQK